MGDGLGCCLDHMVVVEEGGRLGGWGLLPGSCGLLLMKGTLLAQTLIRGLMLELKGVYHF
jgi:hypothetical protein